VGDGDTIDAFHVPGQLLDVHVVGNVTAAVADVNADFFADGIFFGVVRLHRLSPVVRIALLAGF
jgi:hypothetical protein